MSELPPGFELDAAPSPQMAQMPTLPAGFELDAPARGAMDQLTGSTGQRYQTWPERLVRGIGSSIGSGATLPGDVYAGRAQLPSSGAVPGSVPFGDPNSAGPRVADLALLANPTNPAVRAGDLAFPGAQRALSPQQTAAPTIEALKDAASAGYNSPVVKGLEVKPSSIGVFAQSTGAKLNAEGFDELLAPKTFGILGKLEKAPEGAVVTGDNLNSMRKLFGNAAGSADKQEAKAAVKAIQMLDDMLAKLPEADVLAGDAAAAAKTFGTARGNYAAAMRAQTVDNAVTKAERQASAANSGANLDNATRQQFKNVLNSPSKSRGFTADETAQAERIIAGSATGNAVRRGGKLLGGGGGLGASLTTAGGAGLGAMAGGPVGAAIGGVVAPLAGYALNALGNRMTAREVAKLSEMIRSSAPLSKSMEDFGAKASAFQNLSGPKTASAAMLAARNLSNNLKDAGITMSPADIFRSIQGPARSAAEPDQQN